MFIRPKDYISIDNKLFFAVVSEYQEDDRALTWLRYVKDENGMRKLETEEAAKLMNEQYPQFVFYSEYADIELHGIPLDEIEHVLRPDQGVMHLLHLESPDDIQKDAISVIQLLIDAGIRRESIGITGSLLLGTQNENSDIDMIIYGREQFFKVRELIKTSLDKGELKALDEAMWQDAYQRRGCELSFEEYKKYELKKFNKFISGSTKVDVTMVAENFERVYENGPYKKAGKDKIVAVVIEDTYAYDFPSRYFIDHENYNEVVSYTATYTGQAVNGDTIEVAGFVEQGKDGKKRILVGTNREATGAYLRVID
jgi:predicted nucleotidyltransferase